MNKLGKAIEYVVDECLNSTYGYIDVDKNVAISAEWASWDLDEEYDVITVYIHENNIVKFRYQLDETKTNGYKG